MPEQDFSVRIDQDDLAKLNLAAALTRAHDSGDNPEAAVDTGHHGAHDNRQAARGRSERDHARRAASSAKSRSYAFRRS